MCVHGLRRLAPLVCLVFLAFSQGCAAPNYASDAEVAAVEHRLLAPFMSERDVVADVLEIELSANFFNHVAQPARNPQLHTFDQTKVDGDDVHRWGSSGGVQSPLRFSLGEVDFAVLETATMRVLGTGKDMALRVHAAGHVSEVRPGAAIQNWREIQIQDGSFRAR